MVVQWIVRWSWDITDVGSNLNWQSIKRKGSVHSRARPGMYMYGAVYTGREYVQGGGVYTGGAKFFLICF